MESHSYRTTCFAFAGLQAVSCNIGYIDSPASVGKSGLPINSADHTDSELFMD